MQNRLVVEIEIRLFQFMRRTLLVEWNHADKTEIAKKWDGCDFAYLL